MIEIKFKLFFGLHQTPSYMEKKLLEIINHVLESSDRSKLNDLNATLNLRTDLGMDSFQLAELTVRIEDEFNVDIFENGIINTIGEIIKILENVR